MKNSAYYLPTSQPARPAALPQVALFSIGEAALLRAAKPSSGLTVLVQALTAQRVPGTVVDAAASQAAAAAQDAASGAAAVAGAAGCVPTSVQAHAWICLGKLCLTDEPLAKKCVPLFVMVRALNHAS